MLNRNGTQSTTTSTLACMCVRTYALAPRTNVRGIQLICGSLELADHAEPTLRFWPPARQHTSFSAAFETRARVTQLFQSFR